MARTQLFAELTKRAIRDSRHGSDENIVGKCPGANLHARIVNPDFQVQALKKGPPRCPEGIQAACRAA